MNAIPKSRLLFCLTGAFLAFLPLGKSKSIISRNELPMQPKLPKKMNIGRALRPVAAFSSGPVWSFGEAANLI